MSDFDIVGQERAAKVLGRMLAAQKIPSALLFTGPSGVGKSMMARLFVRALVCSRRGSGSDAWGCPPGASACQDCAAVDMGNHPDVMRVNLELQLSVLGDDVSPHAKTLRVDTIRHVLSRMGLEALKGGWKAVVIEDADVLETAAANALLKMLEEPLPRTLWILVSARGQKLPKTVLSRCQEISFARLKSADIPRILAARGLKPDRARLLAGISEGSPGRALELDGILDDLSGLLSDPAAPATAADALPKELALARMEVGRVLSGLSQSLRPADGTASPGFGRFAAAMRDFSRLRKALEANADPRVVMSLAVAAAQQVR